jgi:hypothetical protein
VLIFIYTFNIVFGHPVALIYNLFHTIYFCVQCNDIVLGLLVWIYCAAAWVLVCYCVVPKYVGVVIMYAPLTLGS